MIAQDSALFWFPRINATRLRTEVPKTVFVLYDEQLLEPSMHGQDTAEYTKLYYNAEQAVRDIGGYPAFIRTDITSAKHLGQKAICVKNEDDLNTALLKTLGHAFLKTYFSPIRSSAIMIRPFLDLKGTRTAFDGLRIGNEVRVFASQEGVQCLHYYWPSEALRDHMDDGYPPDQWWPSTWLPTKVRDDAVMATKAMEKGKWSIDFAEDQKGKFWLLDMATAGNSFHAPECKHAEADEENKL